MPTSIIILAAGQGTRMRSGLPKVLQPLAGRPLLSHVVATSRSLEAERIYIVHGHGAELVKREFADQPVEWVLQEQQLGTGHAVAQAIAHIPDEHDVLVLYGDVPLIKAETLRELLAAVSTNSMSLLTVRLDDPSGYGRIIRGQDGRIIRIVEHKDATDSERRVNEINTGLMAVKADKLKRWIKALDNSNAQGEYYLTDIISMAADAAIEVIGILACDPDEAHGINDKLQLAHAEAILRERNARTLMQNGVTLTDPARFDLRGTLSCERDVQIDVNVVFEGEVHLGENVRIGSHCVIRNAVIGSNTVIDAFTHIDSAQIGQDCKVGPYARIRPETVLKDEARVGNFVETKKSVIGRGSKINHLSYIGDTEVGEQANIGAGTITCNYDGVNKHRTVIGDKAFVGSNTSLVAPVTIGNGATIGAGSVITRDVDGDALAVSRARQTTISGWTRPTRK